MKWFKHDSDASMDAKLKRVRNKYGMEGYGLYWYCLELVARGVEKHNLNFELEHDAELISADSGIHQERVQEMMTDFVRWGLFENSDGRITCLKMATRTDEYTQILIRSQAKLPTNSRPSPDNVPVIRTDIRDIREEKEKKQRVAFAPPSLEDVKTYCAERRNSVNPTAFLAFYDSNGWMVGKNKMKDWRAAVRTWEQRGSNTGGQPPAPLRERYERA